MSEASASSEALRVVLRYLGESFGAKHLAAVFAEGKWTDDDIDVMLSGPDLLVELRRDERTTCRVYRNGTLVFSGHDLTGCLETPRPLSRLGPDRTDEELLDSIRAVGDHHLVERPSDNTTGDLVVHLVRRGRYPHVVIRGGPVQQHEDLHRVTCSECLALAGAFLKGTP